MRKATFGGANVFLSRNLVAPEVYDAVHDALELNGAQVFLCCDPSRNSPGDYHVISSHDHEKFEDLRSKGCNLIGPQCVLSCAKEHRVLPNQGYTCCLAMDGVTVLASGFDKDEKVIIEKLVTAMGGTLQTKPSVVINFVIVKDVMAAKYKYALNVLKKPIVNLNWLFQCWAEHRVVPQELFRILPFTGLTICVTRIPPDERKELEKLIVQNGGRYSADLTKKCTHLVSDAPIGDKYVVARRWGHIHVVTRKWVDQSIAKRGCLDEGLYTVVKAPTCDGMKNLQKEHCPQELSNSSTLSASRPAVDDLEATLSQAVASSCADAQLINDKNIDAPAVQMNDERNYDCHVAEDSEEEDNDLYLSNCRICLVGFEDKEQANLVNMIRKGGGTRHILLSEKLTHIILGSASEEQKREVRRFAAWGVIHVVTSSWLEECDRTKREVSVVPSHIAEELLVSKVEPSCKVSGVKKSNCSTYVPHVPIDLAYAGKMSEVHLSDNRRGREASSNGVKDDRCAEVAATSHNSFQLYTTSSKSKNIGRAETNSGPVVTQSSGSLNIFEKKSFCFSSAFPVEQRDEVIRWIKEGGGVLVDDGGKTKADFIIECHGLLQCATDISQATVVSTHWIKSSLDDHCMHAIESHILYSPLRCHTPLPGFERLRFCVSQYEEKDRVLLMNLCITLGAKFSYKLTKKSTHLLCKFTNGPKYDAACNWGIQSVTAEWLTECIKQDKMVPLDPFRPRAVTAEDKEAGFCTETQYPTQAVSMVSGCNPMELLNRVQKPENDLNLTTGNSSVYGKRPRLPDLDSHGDACKRNRQEEDVRGGSNAVPDVADAIEDLLAHSNMVEEVKFPGTSSCDQTVFSSEHSSILDQSHANPPSAYGMSRRWLNRTEKQDRGPNPAADEGKVGTFDAFTETQTDSQVVGYEEDLSGRQKIIDRVRSQSMTLTPN